MLCPRCQTENREGRRFCSKCAAPLAVICGSCGFTNDPGDEFCGGCAQSLRVGTAIPPRFQAPETYTPKHLAEKILTSKAALEGERKQVTVLFADLKGSMELLADRDPEEARKILDPVLERMMEAVHRYEGTVNQVMGDGIMALFGAPVAHEDHALRACYAALRMQDTLKRYADDTRRSHGVEVQIRVGLNSGEVVVRSVGSDLHMDYTAVGQTTHLAARMEQLAPPGTVRMTGETMRLTEGYVDVRPLGPMPVKGLLDPLEVFELTGAGQARTRLQAAALRGLTRFVGRDAEIEHLRRVLGQASAGHGQVVAIVGEAGVGKSRLTYEFMHSHRVQDWLILEASSVSYGKATSYLPVIDLLKGYFKIQERDELREIRERVTGKLLALDRALEPTLPALLSLFDVPPDDESWRRLDPAQRRQRTLDAVKAVLLREAREQPLLLIFEDLHWIDGETQALLDSIVESLGSAPVLLLVNYRPEYEHRWGSKTYYSQMRLDTLPVETAGELLEALLGQDPSLAPLKQLLVRRGNPLFLEETVRTLVETKALVGGEGRYRLTQPVPSIQVPATVQAILAARIDRLPGPVKHVLQAAAVIGKNVSFALLAPIAEQSEDELLRGLNHLQTAEFLYETSLFPELEYAFKHALTLEVAYHSLLRDRRRVLHQRVLDTLEQRWVGREGENAELLAYHASRADVWDRAARYFYQAGERAFANARYSAGTTFFQAAVDALDAMGDSADLKLKLDAWLELWSARVTISQFDSLRELGEHAAALARHLDDGPRLAQVQVRQAQAIVYLGVIPGALEAGVEMAREAFARAQPSDVRTRSYAQFIVGNAYRELGRLADGRLADAVPEFHTGISLFDGLARHSAERGLVFPICVSLGAWCAEAEASRGAFKEALESARRALQLATDINHVNSVSVASSYLGYVHVLRGEFATAVPLLERGIAIAIEQKLPRRPGEALPYLAYALVMLGQRERGLDCLARARQASTGEKAHWSAYGALRAAAYLAANCPEEAKDEIQRGLTEAKARNALGYRGPLRCLEGESLAPVDSAAALDRFGEALVLATELGMRPLVAHCHLGLGKLYRRTGKREQAQEHLTSATTMYREMGMTYWLEQAESELRQFA